MAWYAKIENSKVVDVTFVVDNLDSVWLYREFGGTWLKCAEDNSIRGIFPAVGFDYSVDDDAFIPTQPYASWVFNKQTYSWECPVPYPTDGGLYTWNELTQTWDAVPDEQP
jgi:hypothetical protein